MGRLAAALAYTGVEQRKPVIARQALRMARRLTDKATLADVLASAHWATSGPATLRESIALAEELGRVADEVGDSRLRVLAHVWLLHHLLELGDNDAVMRELDALQHLAEKRSERYFKWVLAVTRANRAYLEGRLEQFETLAHEALAHRFEGDDEPARRVFGVQMLLAHESRGRLDELVETVENSVARDSQIAAIRCLLAHIYAQLKRREQARQALEALAHADFEDVPRDATWLPALSWLTEAVALLDDVPRAQLLYKLLLPYADRCMNMGAGLCGGSVSRPLGLLATTMSRHEEAERHFEQALKMNAQIRSPLWIAHTQHNYAHMLLTRGRPRDNDKALELLKQALATAEQLGLKALADKTRPLKLTAQTAAPSLALPRPV